MVTAKVWCMKKQFEGAPKDEDFELKEEQLPALKDGQFACEALVWSVDPYNRAYSKMLPDGAPMIGFQVSKVIESKNSEYPVGTVLLTHAGWRTHSVHDATGQDVFSMVNKIPPEILSKFPTTYFVGALGMPGATAYFGVNDILEPKSGQTLVVNAGAGAVGSIVGQMGKIYGATVLGYAGSAQKVTQMKEMGFDHAYNYKQISVADSLKEGAPKGVDCFFDNVGFDFNETVMAVMNDAGRICQCGAIAGYNDVAVTKINPPYMYLIGKGLIWQGLHVRLYFHRYAEFITKMAGWIGEGKVKVQETKYKGFEKMPQALMDVLAGKNHGKAVIEP